MFMSSVKPEVSSEFSNAANVTQHNINTFVVEATEVSLNLTKKYWCLNFSWSFVVPLPTRINQNRQIFPKNNKADE